MKELSLQSMLGNRHPSPVSVKFNLSKLK